MATMTALASALLHGQEFDCTVEQFRRFFQTYEVSRRGTDSLRDRQQSAVMFGGACCDAMLDTNTQMSQAM